MDENLNQENYSPHASQNPMPPIPPQSEKKIFWPLISVIITAVVVLTAGGYFVYKYYFTPEENLEPIGEAQKVLEISRPYVIENAPLGLEFNLELVRLLNNWATVRVVPTNMDIDNVMVILEKINGEWTPRDMGTAFPYWYGIVPELFDTEIDTSSWRTYRNEEYGFEVKYPADLITEKHGLSFVIKQKSDSVVEVPSLIFSVDKNPENLSVQQYYDGNPGINYYGQTEEINIVDVKIDNQNALKFDPYISFAGGEIIIVPRDFWFLVIDDFGGSFGSDGLLNQVLSTLKFIESEIDTSNWQTYRNEEYGFEFMYPSDFYAQTAPGVRIATVNKRLLGFEGDELGSIEIRIIFEGANDEKAVKQNVVSELKETQILVDGREAQSITGLLDDRVFGWGGRRHGYVFIDDTYIRLEYDLENQEINNLFNQILSTFKFIE